MTDSNYSLKFTPIAKEDLNQIYEYILNTLLSEIAANKLMKNIETSIMRLTEFPLSCSYVLDEPLKAKGYRKLIVDNYVIFYLVNKDKKQIVIMRILYGARDYENLI